MEANILQMGKDFWSMVFELLKKHVSWLRCIASRFYFPLKTVGNTQSWVCIFGLGFCFFIVSLKLFFFFFQKTCIAKITSTNIFKIMSITELLSSHEGLKQSSQIILYRRTIIFNLTSLKISKSCNFFLSPFPNRSHYSFVLCFVHHIYGMFNMSVFVSAIFVWEDQRTSWCFLIVWL